MFKKATLERVQYAVNAAANIICQQEEFYAAAKAEGQAMQSYAERQQNTLALASLLLEED